MPMPKRMRKTRFFIGVQCGQNTGGWFPASWTGLHFPQEELRFVLDKITKGDEVFFIPDCVSRETGSFAIFRIFAHFIKRHVKTNSQFFGVGYDRFRASPPRCPNQFVDGFDHVNRIRDCPVPDPRWNG